MATGSSEAKIPTSGAMRGFLKGQQSHSWFIRKAKFKKHAFPFLLPSTAYAYSAIFSCTASPASVSIKIVMLGQAATQLAQPMHFERSSTAFSFSIVMASGGQTISHSPQPLHRSVLKTGA